MSSTSRTKSKIKSQRQNGESSNGLVAASAVSPTQQLMPNESVSPLSSDHLAAGSDPVAVRAATLEVLLGLLSLTRTTDMMGIRQDLTEQMLLEVAAELSELNRRLSPPVNPVLLPSLRKRTELCQARLAALYRSLGFPEQEATESATHAMKELVPNLS